MAAEPLARQTQCSLRFLGDSMHVISFAYYRQSLLAEHWQHHYHVRLGVPRSNLRIFVHLGGMSDSGSDSIATAEDNLRAFVRMFRGSNLTVHNHSFTDKRKINMVNSHIASLPLRAWVVNADVDEFFTYPCDLPARLVEHDSWCAFMQDQLAASGRIEPVRRADDVDIFDQFPVPCFVRSHLRTSIQVTKVAIMAAHTGQFGKVGRLQPSAPRTYKGSHSTSDSWNKQKCRPLPLVTGGGALSHISLTSEQQTLLLDKVSIHAIRMTLVRDYKKLMRFFANHSGPDGADARQAAECQEPFRGNELAAPYLDNAWTNYFPCGCGTGKELAVLKSCGCRCAKSCGKCPVGTCPRRPQTMDSCNRSVHLSGAQVNSTSRSTYCWRIQRQALRVPYAPEPHALCGPQTPQAFCPTPARMQTGKSTLKARTERQIINDQVLPALIISASHVRFMRAAKATTRLGFSPVRLPSVFLRAGSLPCPKDVKRNGLRLAHRNAWQIIALANKSMAVFQDDAQPALGATKADVARYIQKYEERKPDVLFLGGEGKSASFLCAHAQWITPNGARRLLEVSNTCLTDEDDGLDQIIHCECTFGADPIMCGKRRMMRLYPNGATRAERYRVWKLAASNRSVSHLHAMDCVNAPIISRTGRKFSQSGKCVDEESGLELPYRCLGHGFFLQNRKGVSSYIHGADGKKFKPLTGSTSLADCSVGSEADGDCHMARVSGSERNNDNETVRERERERERVREREQVRGRTSEKEVTLSPSLTRSPSDLMSLSLDETCLSHSLNISLGHFLIVSLSLVLSLLTHSLYIYHSLSLSFALCHSLTLSLSRWHRWDRLSWRAGHC